MSTPRLESLAAELGADDLFVFHVLSDERMVNLDGWGRGSGWAGNVCLDPETEHFLASAITAGTARIGPGSPTRVFGPYWAEEAVAVKMNGHVVALGGRGVTALSQEAVMRAAGHVVEEISAVKANKLLADKLEITEARLSVATVEAESLQSAAALLASMAARSLSCEFGAILLLGDDVTLAVADEGWRSAATNDEVITALLPLIPALVDGILVEQDLRQSPYAVPPLSFGHGLVSRCTVSVNFIDHSGLLTVAHAGSAPRGFTDLCRNVASTMAEAATQTLSRHC